MLRVGTWHVASGTLTLRKPNGVDTTLNYVNWIPFCHKDDYIKFDSGNIGYQFPGTNLCNASDADSTQFIWTLLNGETQMDLYNGFNNTFDVTESILLPYFFDTVATSPIVVVDTFLSAVAGAAMTPPSPGLVDSFWKLHFDTTAVPGLDIYNATITNFSSSSFTLNYAFITTYPDSTGFHTGYDAANNIDMNPIWRPDTVHYSITYTH